MSVAVVDGQAVEQRADRNNRQPIRRSTVEEVGLQVLQEGPALEALTGLLQRYVVHRLNAKAGQQRRALGQQHQLFGRSVWSRKMLQQRTTARGEQVEAVKVDQLEPLQLAGHGQITAVDQLLCPQ